MNELFPVAAVTQDSPRLKWLKAHQVQTHHHANIEPGEESPETGETLYPWVACVGPLRLNELRADYAFGDTEDEACVALAKAKGWRTWLEQDLT